jgi:acyl carrier protein
MWSFTPDDGLLALARLLESDRVQVGVVPLDVRQWVEFYPAVASSRMLSHLVAAQQVGFSGPTGNRELLDRLAAAKPGERAGLLEAVLRTHASQVLRMPEDKLEVEVSLTSLGMDSLMGLELRNRIEAALGITVPVTLLWTYPTIAALSRHLAGEVCEAVPVEPPRPTTDSTTEVMGMSRDELEHLIVTEFEALK